MEIKYQVVGKSIARNIVQLSLNEMVEKGMPPVASLPFNLCYTADHPDYEKVRNLDIDHELKLIF